MSVQLSGQLLPSVKFSQFFDRSGMEGRIDRAKFRYLRRAGGTVRLTSRRLIRRRKTISQPGRPPHSQTGRLKQSILFGLDKISESVVVGLSLMFRPRGSRKNPNTVPNTLEFGGSSMHVRRRSNGEQVISTQHYRPRPFMRPALETVQPRLPRMFAEAYS